MNTGSRKITVFVGNAAGILSNPSKSSLQGLFEDFHKAGEDPVLRGIEHKETGEHHWAEAGRFDHGDLMQRVGNVSDEARKGVSNRSMAASLGFHRLFAMPNGSILKRPESGDEGSLSPHAVAGIGSMLKPPRLKSKMSQWD